MMGMLHINAIFLSVQKILKSNLWYKSHVIIIKIKNGGTKSIKRGGRGGGAIFSGN